MFDYILKSNTNFYLCFSNLIIKQIVTLKKTYLKKYWAIPNK